MTAIRIGYARCSTDKQDLTAQQRLLLELGVAAERIYLDTGLTGTNRSRPGLDQALAAVRPARERLPEPSDVHHHRRLPAAVNGSGPYRQP